MSNLGSYKEAIDVLNQYFKEAVSSNNKTLANAIATCVYKLETVNKQAQLDMDRYMDELESKQEAKETHKAGRLEPCRYTGE